MTTIPSRGFSRAEFEARTRAAQRMMYAQKMDGMVLTTEADVRYFSGFFTQFWQSPTRPWFLLIPLEGKPIAVIPTIGEVGMRSTWIEDIRCWSAPQPKDDGISLLKQAIEGLPGRFSQVGIPLGHGSHLRMPAQDFQRLKKGITSNFADCSALLAGLCSVKSKAEVEKIQYACNLVSDSFAALPDFASLGDSERRIVQAMKLDLLKRGADNVPFMVSASGPDGYDNIIMGPGDRILENGDLLIIDTGTVYDGYFCDFDRNFAFGRASVEAHRVYELVYKATEAGFKVVRPGATTFDVWQAMWAILESGGAQGNDVGRMGHGLGAQLTEWPSISEKDHSVLEAGMVITLEPGMTYDNSKQMVHEENILITEDGARMLSRRAPQYLPVID